MINNAIWGEKIYTVEYDEQLETDVQDIFIDSLYEKEDKLSIRDEAGRIYLMDTEARKVKKIWDLWMIRNWIY